MAKKGIAMVTTLALTALAGVWLYDSLPAWYNPFAPLSPLDPPTMVTRYKLRQMANNPQACLALLDEARKRDMIQYRVQTPTQGDCPLAAPVRVLRFGEVKLSSSFLASCPLALSSAMYVQQQAKPISASMMGSPLVRIDHYGSYACRNIYHRANARLSEHATADALDVSAFRFANGQQISVLKGWKESGTRGETLRALFGQSCLYFCNALGPDYNAAHANHFHLGMRGFGICR
ncbi:extensin family protein [Cronobacter sakazakii]|uniref:extensin-like domain-containing protein n=1 Tax=Cronobacter sakazakii TaxID=28141 RepID=UPI001BCEB46B|nr:extensin family protein [Cronobacter sakazakii]MBS4494606.1 extensin family protein [Cronobacter sakazakii]